MTDGDRAELERAIRERRKVQLAYRRRNGSTSLHIVAPVDIRFGETEGTKSAEYLWAHCYAEGESEMHRCDGIISVRVMDECFDAAELLREWPQRRWPLPEQWSVSRSWDSRGDAS